MFTIPINRNQQTLKIFLVFKNKNKIILFQICYHKPNCMRLVSHYLLLLNELVNFSTVFYFEHKMAYVKQNTILYNVPQIRNFSRTKSL